MGADVANGVDAAAALVSGGSRPKFNDYAEMARWLVHQNTWGVVSTSSVQLQGVPFGYVHHRSTPLLPTE